MYNGKWGLKVQKYSTLFLFFLPIKDLENKIQYLLRLLKLSDYNGGFLIFFQI